MPISETASHVVQRGAPSGPEAWERGWKDLVISHKSSGTCICRYSQSRKSRALGGACRADVGVWDGERYVERERWRNLVHYPQSG